MHPLIERWTLITMRMPRASWRAALATIRSLICASGFY
jgi:hypothetical protein